MFHSLYALLCQGVDLSLPPLSHSDRPINRTWRPLNTRSNEQILYGFHPGRWSTHIYRRIENPSESYTFHLTEEYCLFVCGDTDGRLSDALGGGGRRWWHEMRIWLDAVIHAYNPVFNGGTRNELRSRIIECRIVYKVHKYIVVNWMWR